jgi:hypothetical protein
VYPDGAPTLCDRVQLELVGGLLTDDHRAHLDAQDTETGEDVAVKLVTRLGGAGPDLSADEVVNARRVRHPGVCRVYHSERHGRLRAIVMEHVDGRTPIGDPQLAAGALNSSTVAAADRDA